MENKRQNTTERRLAQVRALKERYFSEELTVEERLEAKDARIELLENQLAELKRRVDALDRKVAPPQPPQSERRTRPTRERSPLFESEQHGFDFYRD